MYLGDRGPLSSLSDSDHYVVGTSHIPSRTLPNHFLVLISTALIFIQHSTSNQIQLLLADKSALIAAATDLGSAPPRFV
jgi:Flp pilus assembly protein protease CpaA